MYFQVLDTKRNCKNVFYDGKLEDEFRDCMTHTWSYTPHFEQTKKPSYAEIWCLGKSLDEMCPDNIKLDWNDINLKANAFMKSLKTSKINLQNNCLYDLLPEHFLLEFYLLKNKITEHVFENFSKPKNYDFLSDLTALIYQISTRKLNINYDNLDWSKKEVRDSFNKIKNVSSTIKYTPWVSATGRLSTKTNSFPILNLNKSLRSCLVPTNDLFLELDFNSAELRVLFALLDQEQPKDDVHGWIAKNIFSDKYSRDDVKRKVFSWLYNPKAKNKKLNSFLDRDKVLEKYYNQGSIITPYDRKIYVEEEKAVNYMIQSTASDLLLTAAIAINKFLQGKKSFVCFCIHDSLVLDISSDDKQHLQELIDIFSQTKLGFFKTNVSLGKNFGSMRKIV